MRAVADSGYAELIRTKTIEATLWLAVFSPDFAYEGAVDRDHITLASDLGVRLFVEDYARLDDDGAPRKLWLNG
ncbi:hypothetical protein [Roseiarcus fermentans]|uniref:hypothetical protein n=1 Tax=Roseiarcus fermentans TaxID=1473586 RepID=UPI000DEAFB02|nr:hypothetical protein [Roseiarcus fermentans]